MSRKQQKVFWPTLILVVTSLSTWVLITGRPRLLRESREKKWTAAANPQTATKPDATRTKSPSPRNLSLQAAAFNMGRRLGARFAGDLREKSDLSGTLTIGSEQRMVQTIRSQTDDGEQVEIRIAGSRSSLTWDWAQGSMAATGRASGSDRELIERLALDSPDQFVLAQLRGASYRTVATNVRPVDAGDNYNGPLWNVVRVDEPQSVQEEKKPQSIWRLYYINTRTGLIDRVVSELQGEKIEAEISDWINQNGENVPGQITWTRKGQTIMQYRLTSFSRVPAAGVVQ
jgi:hypothetical protein